MLIKCQSGSVTDWLNLELPAHILRWEAGFKQKNGNRSLFSGQMELATGYHPHLPRGINKKKKKIQSRVTIIRRTRGTLSHTYSIDNMYIPKQYLLFVVHHHSPDRLLCTKANGETHDKLIQ